MRPTVGTLLPLTAFFVVLLVSGTGFAQQEGVIELEESVYQGERHAPEAFYVVTDSELDYERLEVERSFLSELFGSVDEPPFEQ